MEGYTTCSDCGERAYRRGLKFFCEKCNREVKPGITRGWGNGKSIFTEEKSREWLAIEDGPIFDEFEELLENRSRMFFKIEGNFHPHRVDYVEYLSGSRVRILGFGPFGIFEAIYGLVTRQGHLLRNKR